MRKRDLLNLDAEAVRCIRVRRQMTREELAAAASCSMSTVRLAHAGIPVSLTKARDIARALRVPLEQLCRGDIGRALVTGRSETAA